MPLRASRLRIHSPSGLAGDRDPHEDSPDTWLSSLFASGMTRIDGVIPFLATLLGTGRYSGKWWPVTAG
jgi:hypothetical protein